MPAGAPRAALVPGAHEHQVQPDRVGAVARDQRVGVLDVAAALAHPLAVGAQDLALVEQPVERLALVHQPQVAHRLGEEPAVQQVHHGVLGAARVLVHGGPVLDEVHVHRALGVVRREVAEPVPGRVDERVHRVRLAPRGRAALRAVDGQEVHVAGERVVAGAAVVHGLGQQDRQVGLGHRHRAAGRAVDDRDRRAPVALAADQPVAQPVRDRLLALALLAQPLDDVVPGLGRRLAGEPAGVDHDLVDGVLRECRGQLLVRVRVLGHHDVHDRQAERLGEREVALVVGGHGHDRAGAVRAQHVVRDEDRDPGAVDGVDRVRADGDAGLLAIRREAVDLRLRGRLRPRRRRPRPGDPARSASRPARARAPGP